MEKIPWNNWLPVFLSDTSLAKESIAGNSIPFTRRTLLVVLNSAVRYPKPNIWRWWQRFGGILGSLYAYKGSWVNKIKSEKHNIPFGSQKGIVMGWVGPKYCDNPRLTNKSEVMSFDGWDPSHGNQLWKMGAAGLFLMKHGQSGRSDHYGSNHHLVGQFGDVPKNDVSWKIHDFPTCSHNGRGYQLVLTMDGPPQSLSKTALWIYRERLLCVKVSVWKSFCV